MRGILTLPEAARELGVSPSVLNRAAAVGDIHTVRQGRTHTIAERELLRFAAQPRLVGRPWTAQTAWNVIHALEHGGDVPATDWRRAVAQLRRRAARRVGRAHPGVLRHVSAEASLLSGHAVLDDHERLALVKGGPTVLDVYGTEESIDHLFDAFRIDARVHDYNVVAHVVEPAIELPTHAPWPLVVLDLIDSKDARLHGLGLEEWEKLWPWKR